MTGAGHGLLAGKSAIVCGGSRGIGLGIATRLAEEGASVMLTSRSQEAAEAAAARVPGAIGVAAHVLDEDAARACIDLAIGQFGAVDLLVNNVASNPAYGDVFDQTHDQFNKIFDINVWAPILWSRLCWEASMRDHGGAIVNTASIGAFDVGPALGLYRVTKSALVHLTTQLALELSPRVRVNAVAPGLVRTQLAEVLWKDDESRIARDTPMQRIGEAEDIGDAVVFLASDLASWVTGQTLCVDGGQLLAKTQIDVP